MPEDIVAKIHRFENEYELAEYVEGVANASGNPKSSSNWIMTED